MLFEASFADRNIEIGKMINIYEHQRVGYVQKAQVCPPDLAVLDSWSTIYMMTPGN